jgi:hypothetical protein
VQAKFQGIQEDNLAGAQCTCLRRGKTLRMSDLVPPALLEFCHIVARHPKPHRLLSHDSTCVCVTQTEKEEGAAAPRNRKSTNTQATTHTGKHAHHPIITEPQQSGVQSLAGVPGQADKPLLCHMWCRLVPRGRALLGWAAHSVSCNSAPLSTKGCQTPVRVHG